MNEYKPTIGLEVHVELKTRTKMFCDSLNDPSEKQPNTNVCPVCLGHPGTLPTINKKADEEVIKVGLALGGKINPTTKFDRKNYFYPDLPKGYQISQYDEPLVVGGELNGVRLTRIHLEEDAGTLGHAVKGSPTRGSTQENFSLVDFNRAGVPLMELVTEPDIQSAEQAVAFGKELQLILRYVGASDADMERGQMRLEANVSLRKTADERGLDPQMNADTIRDNPRENQRKSAPTLGTKVEIKNINSFKALGSAIAYELERQKEVLEKGEKVQPETRGWDDTGQKTVSQRSKEEAHDYRYFPEPDLPPFETSVFDPEDMRRHLPELPKVKRERFKKQYNLELNKNEYKLDEKQIELLVVEPRMAEYFEKMVSEIQELLKQDSPRPADPRYPTFLEFPGFLYNVVGLGFNCFIKNLQDYIKSNNLAAESVYKKFPPSQLASFVYHVEFGLPGFHGNSIKDRENVEEVLKLLLKSGLSGAKTRVIFRKMLEKGMFGTEELMEILKSEEFDVIDVGELENIAREVLAENPAAVADYKKGKTASLQFLVGKAMGKLKGRGNPEALQGLFKKLLL